MAHTLHEVAWPWWPEWPQAPAVPYCALALPDTRGLAAGPAPGRSWLARRPGGHGPHSGRRSVPKDGLSRAPVPFRLRGDMMT